MKSTFVFLLTALCQLTASAEGERISLAEFDLGLTNADYYVEAVIDARQEKHCIGFIQKGMMDKKVAAFFEGGFAQEMGPLINRSFSQNGLKDPIVLKVNHLFVYEVPYGDLEVATAEINVTFLKKVGNGYIELLEAANWVSVAKLNATKTHSRNIVGALKACFVDYNDRKKSNQLLSTAIEPGSLDQYTLDKKDYKINESPIFTKGLYRSFGDFKDNVVDGTARFSIDYRRNDKQDLDFAYVDWNGGTKEVIKEIWGFCDGTDHYVRINNVFFKISKDGEDFRVKAPVRTDVNIIITGSVFAGLAGILIGEAISSASVKYPDFKIDFVTMNNRMNRLKHQVKRRWLSWRRLMK